MQNKPIQFGRFVLLLAVYICFYMAYGVVMHKQKYFWGNWVQLGSLFAAAFISGTVFTVVTGFWDRHRRRTVASTDASERAKLSSK
ncbi:MULTISPECIES: hypothetical protein [Acidobacteriaceae]|uniref:hypothetical protein n=1 Tax=Acidobacteriaceae TaxID=204434 RepID=UPI00131E260C|nr:MULTISPECIES: hypothetical protein [Acidobacteriaceae]MDW5267407.1 hypothetical protein [Edaphobacter sp.]